MKEILPISKIGLDLLLQMLEVRPDVRPSAKECLEHEWFKEDFTTLQNMIMGSRINKLEKGQDIYDDAGAVSFIDAPCLFLKD
jgi:serine/threonine protein kinase